MKINDLNKIRKLEFDDIAIGDEVWFEKKIGREEMKKFEDLTGNTSTLHTNLEYAKQKGFRGIVVYGLLAASYFSTLFGMFLPGEKCLCKSHNIIYKNPLIENELIKVYGKVTHKIDGRQILIMKTQIFNEKNVLIIDGEAEVKVI